MIPKLTATKSYSVLWNPYYKVFKVISFHKIGGLENQEIKQKPDKVRKNRGQYEQEENEVLYSEKKESYSVYQNGTESNQQWLPHLWPAETDNNYLPQGSVIYPMAVTNRPNNHMQKIHVSAQHCAHVG